MKRKRLLTAGTACKRQAAEEAKGMKGHGVGHIVVIKASPVCRKTQVVRLTTTVSCFHI